MNKTKWIILIASAVLSLLVIAGAVVIAHNRQKPAAVAPTTVKQRPVSQTELADADGKDGRMCYVAVDGTVYQIKDFSLWQDGQHKTSGGLAYCGADMTAAMNKSPHGRKVLDLLIKIGPLES